MGKKLKPLWITWALLALLGVGIGVLLFSLCSCASAYKAIGISTDQDIARVSGEIQAAADIFGPYGTAIGAGLTGLLTVGWRVARHAKNKKAKKA